MRRLTIAITAGEHTCRDGKDGPFCPFIRDSHWCDAFNKRLPYVNEDGTRRYGKTAILGWLGRLPECKAAEQRPNVVDVPLFDDAGKVNVAGLAQLDVLRPLIIPPAEPQGHSGDRSDLNRRIAKALRGRGAKARAVRDGVRVTLPKRGEQ